MGFANKNDRHATHLSPRELLFNGLHPASVPPPSCGTACGSDVASREYRYIHFLASRLVGIRVELRILLTYRGTSAICQRSVVSLKI